MQRYYYTLRRLLHRRQDLYCRLRRCKECGIFFLTDPRNKDRKGLRCPFGCRVWHEKRESTARSVEFHRRHKDRKRQYNRNRYLNPSLQQRREGGKWVYANQGRPEQPAPPLRAADNGSESPKRSLLPVASRGVETIQNVECAGLIEPPAVTAPRGGIEGAATQADRFATANQDVGTALSARPVEEVNGAFSDQIVTYLITVCSLIERRKVHRREVLDMLHAIQRQRRIVKETRLDYIIRLMNRSPPERR